MVVRGPSPQIDDMFSAIPLGADQYLGFMGNRTSYAIDGNAWWNMSSAATPIMTKGPPDSFYSCGQWLTHTERSPTGSSQLLGFVHAETFCNYKIGQTRKSMALAISETLGMTWAPPVQFITSPDPIKPRAVTGEGDCTAVTGGDAYIYAYCRRDTDYQTIVARAPVDGAAQPKNWFKYYQGAWSQPAMAGRSTGLGGIGTGAAHWLNPDSIILTAASKGGIYASFATDKLTFSFLPEVLLFDDGNSWKSPTTTDIVGYAVLLDQSTGQNTLGASGSYFLSHMYVPNGGNFGNRYLVFRPVTMWQSQAEVSPNVGVAFSLWQNTTQNILRTTSAPVVGPDSWTFVGSLGYVMTKPSATVNVKLEECYSPANNGDYLVAIDSGTGCPGGYQWQRTVGWIKSNADDNSVALYGCYSNSGSYHFVSADPNCQDYGAGTLLGYGMAA